jgi:hypothetical protein
MMGSVSRKFAEEYQIATVEVPEFATERFFVELDRLEERCARDFKGAGSLLTRRRSTLSSLFFDSVVRRSSYVSRSPTASAHLDERLHPAARAQLTAFQESSNRASRGMAASRTRDRPVGGWGAASAGRASGAPARRVGGAPGALCREASSASEPSLA